MDGRGSRDFRVLSGVELTLQFISSTDVLSRSVNLGTSTGKRVTSNKNFLPRGIIMGSITTITGINWSENRVTSKNDTILIILCSEILV